jgi:hypothetical protein
MYICICIYIHVYVYIYSEEERRAIHPGELLHALETVTADALQCSKVKAFLVSSKFIGMLYVFIDTYVYMYIMHMCVCMPLSALK